MNIVLEGLSGVGKTYYGKLISQKLNIPFIEFLPKDYSNEVRIFRELVNLHEQNENCILENSVNNAKIIHTVLYTHSMISPKELLELSSICANKVKDSVIVYLKDSYESILKKRKGRGRNFEYKEEATSSFQTNLDNVLSTELKGDIIIDLDLLDMKEDEIVDYISNQIMNYVMLHHRKG